MVANTTASTDITTTDTTTTQVENTTASTDTTTTDATSAQVETTTAELFHLVVCLFKQNTVDELILRTNTFIRFRSGKAKCVF